MTARAHAALPTALTRFAWLMAAMGMLSLVYTLLMTHLLHSPHAYGTTLFHGSFVGSDFSVFAQRSCLFRTPAYWDKLKYPFTYPAPVGVVFALLFRLPHPLACYLSLCIAGLTAWGWWLARSLMTRGIGIWAAAAFLFVTLATMWPLVNLLNTANIEGLLAIVLGCGMLAVVRQRFWLGATLIGLAASMKLYPFILLALLLSRRRYREFAWGLIVAVLTTLTSLALLGPSIPAAQRQISAGLRFVKVAFILATQPDALNYSHSLFSVIKFAVVAVSHSGFHTLDLVLRLYMIFAAIGGVALYTLRICKLPMLNQLLALTICAVLLPPLSADYTLLELLVPFALLCLFAIDSTRSALPKQALSACFGIFACIFAWETFLTVRHSFDRPARTVALVILLILVLRSPFRWDALDTQRGVA